MNNVAAIVIIFNDAYVNNHFTRLQNDNLTLISNILYPCMHRETNAFSHVILSSLIFIFYMHLVTRSIVI